MAMFGRRRSRAPGHHGIPGWHPPPPPADQVYYTSREHHDESPYKSGDRLPPTWHPQEWPSWDRPVKVPRGCAHCDGRGHILMVYTKHDYNNDITSWLHEEGCWACYGTGRIGERERREAEEKRREHDEAVRRNEWAQKQGYRDYGDFYYSEQDRRQKESAAQYPPQCHKCGGSGRVSVTWAMVNPNSNTFVDRPCPRCGGSGIAR